MHAYWLEDPKQTEIDATTLNGEGIHYEALPVAPAEHQARLDQLCQANGYITQDQVALRPDTPNLEGICAKFIPEHFHTEDEVRFVLDGAGIFDIRSNDDRWMRVTVVPGDLIVVPANRHHRFFLTDVKNIQCARLFQDAAGWVAHYRE
ncbi:MAG: 1,2-dihydroxy-3-keto-5-methylthiopentene dioxygenase [Myxococcota bacterium]|jgi:1,2-dihydroxy-3-keto-5-methylthiopentene dioxygenase